MANWAEVEFRKSSNHRCAHLFLSVAADILMLVDFLAGVACGEATRALWYVRFRIMDPSATGAATFLPEVVVGSFTIALALRYLSVKKLKMFISWSLSVAAFDWRLVFALAACATVASVVQIQNVSPLSWVVSWLLLLAMISGATRWSLARYIERLQKSGALRESVAIVGASGARNRLGARMADGANIVGFCETPAEWTGLLHQDEITKLQELGVDGYVDSVVLAVEKDHLADIAELVERLKVLPMQLAICDENEWPLPAEPGFRLLAGVPIKIVSDRPINRRDLLIKTILDKVFATGILVIVSPLMMAIAVGIATTSRGPVIFRQTRQGFCGTRFTMFKFRTMRDCVHTGHRYTQTKRRDPRCTGFGRLLRSTSLDELPQLWNVIRGDMSLVGPRPHADMLDETDRAGRQIVAEYAQRYRVKPGITGWAQIHGARGATSTVEQLRRRVAFDLHYIEHWSLMLDLRIIAQTPFCMMGTNVF